MKATNQESITGRSRVLALASLFVVWLVSALAAPAHADALAKPTDAVAREHQTTGNYYYRHLRDYEKAIEEYKAGALREDAPVFSYNLGHCYRNLGRYEDAIWHYERFLDRGKPMGEVEASVKKFITQMKAEREKAAIKQSPVEPAPASTMGPVSSGQALLVRQPAAERRRGMSLRRKLALGVGAGGVAVVGLGVVLGLRGESFEEDARATCPMSTCARAEEANALIGRGKTSARYANVAFGTGGAMIIGAIVLWVTGSQAEHRTLAIVPQVSRSFAGMAASLSL